MNIAPTTPNIDEAIRIANILIDAKDVIKCDSEADITMQLAEAVMFLSELQVVDDQ